MSGLIKQNRSNLPVDTTSIAGNNIPIVSYNQASAIPSSMSPIKKELSLRDIWDVIARRKWTMLSTLLLTLGLATLYTLKTPASYRADAIVQIEREGAEVVGFGKMTNSTGSFDALNDPFFRTRYEMLKSRVIANKVINELSLYDSLVAPKKKESTFSLSALSTLLGFSTPPPQVNNKAVDYVGEFQKKLTIKPIAATHLVEVVYEAPEAEQARDVVTSIINHFIKIQVENKSETGKYAKDFLSKQLEDSRERLRLSEAALVKYSNEKGILTVDDKQTRQVKKLGNLDDALVQAEIKRIEAESLYLQMKRAGSVSAVLNSPVVGNLKARLVRLEGDYLQMLKTFKPNYPSMVSLRQQINSAKGKLNQEKGAIQRSMEADYLAAKRQETRIRNELKQFNTKMHKLQDSSLDYNTLKREVAANGKLYNSLLQRLDEISIASEVNTSNISIVEPAVTPINKFNPNPKLNLLLGLLSGLILGLAFAFLKEAFDQSIKSDDDLQNITGLPVLSSIPRFSKSNNNKLGLISSTMPDIPAAEAYRILAAKLRAMKKNNDDEGSVMLITSAESNTDKSISASNVASSLAKMGMKVLLVDVDMRKPSLHTNLGIENKSGLSNFLKGEIDLVGITQPLKEVSGLYVITAGKYVNDPVSLLSHERMSYLTTRASQLFDYIVLDAPPVIGFADSLILSSLATSTVIVDQQDSLKINNIKHVLEQLGRVSNNVDGFILVNAKNQLEANNKDYSKYQKKMKKLALTNDKRINFA